MPFKEGISYRAKVSQMKEEREKTKGKKGECKSETEVGMRSVP